MRVRGAEAKVMTKRERYFEELLPHIRSFEGYVAASVLTEEMALEKDIIVSTHPLTPLTFARSFAECAWMRGSMPRSTACSRRRMPRGNAASTWRRDGGHRPAAVLLVECAVLRDAVRLETIR
jgi:hypothetical protein